MTDSTAVFDVITRLLANLPAVMPAGAQVLDYSWDDQSYPPDFVMIGMYEPTMRISQSSGTGESDWAEVGPRIRDETGQITCWASSYNGQADIAAARARVKQIADAVATYLREQPTLAPAGTGPGHGGLPQLLWCSFGGLVDLKQVEYDKGASVSLVFQVGFRARF